jgi:N-acetyl-1-D-myo-inositol-2-amino-2-deoxy-alpha-D-glucopyranoside deacetylase
VRRHVAAAWSLARLPLVAAATVLLFFLAWIGLRASMAGFEPDVLPRAADASLGARILVIAPHPDDETLACGGLIHQAVAGGRLVRVVLLTNGDGFRRIVGGYRVHGDHDASDAFVRLGTARAAEATAALGVLGVPASDVTFLGYPDGSLRDLLTSDWQDGVGLGAPNGCRAVPYPFALSPGSPYSGADLASDLAHVIADAAPTTVIYPDAEDENDDHRTTNAFVTLALDQAGFTGARYTYLVHRGHFPFPWSYVPAGRLAPPPVLYGAGGTWLSYHLDLVTPHVKEKALESYRSQRKAMEPFLAAFIRRNELLATYRPTSSAPTTASAPSPDVARMPGVVVRDPARDSIGRLLNASADIREVALVRGTRTVWVGLRAQDDLAPGVTYRIGLRVLRHDRTVGRLDLDVSGKTVRVADGDSATIAAAGKPPLTAHARTLWVSLPASVFSGAAECLLTGEARSGRTVFDRTAWRPVLLP